MHDFIPPNRIGEVWDSELVHVGAVEVLLVNLTRWREPGQLLCNSHTLNNSNNKDKCQPRLGACLVVSTLLSATYITSTCMTWALTLSHVPRVRPNQSNPTAVKQEKLTLQIYLEKQSFTRIHTSDARLSSMNSSCIGHYMS